MKFFLPAAVLAAAMSRVSAQTASLATQTYFIPMPDAEIYNHTFRAINLGQRGDNVVSLIGIAISTDNTRIFYDQWEDGFEPDATNPTKSTTLIWGDGNPANGCVPKKPCTVDGDRLRAGDVIILENDVPALRPNLTGPLVFDGGDRVQASYPIAVTRAAYPRNGAGSMMAGAVEVLDTTMYGRNFVSPVGEDNASPSPISTNPFQYVAMYVLAAEDNTTVTLPNGSTRRLKMGETTIVSNVNRGQRVTSDKPVLVDLITGDRDSTYELRWYSLMDTAMWEGDYLAPVGDSVAETRIVLYNPGTSQITVTLASTTTTTINVPAGGNAVTGIVPSGAAMRLTSAGTFIALSVHDTTVDGSGMIYDWGYPVMATSWMTSSLLVGLGYGCTGNVCPAGTSERSVVWVAPIEDAWVHLDYNNDGVIDNSTFCSALTGTFFRDPSDKDMSGARFWGTKTNSMSGTPVRITGAWGQNGAFSFSGDLSAMDLGTVVLPFRDIRVTKSAKLVVDADKNNAVSPGDTLEYTIQVQNVGPGLDIAAGAYTVLDDRLPAQVSYIPGTIKATDASTGGMTILDDASGTPFPLDGTGFVSKGILRRRGGTHDYTFQVKVLDSAATAGSLVNSGVLKVTGLTDLPFSVTTPVTPQLRWLTPPPPPPTGSCMGDTYRYYGRTGTLSCTAQQVFLEKVEAQQAAQCVAGRPIKLTLTADVRFNGVTKYDPHWHIARDGGDSLTGNCSAGFLDRQYQQAAVITQSREVNLLKGNVTWTGPNAIDSDECGDVTLSDTLGGIMTYNILLDTEIMCRDANNNGKLQISVCFGWKERNTDSVCSVATKLAAGQLPELYPGSSTTCFCAQYQVPNVVVLNPGTKTYPC